ncbi:TOMM precursor leader peptide-binding protein [Paenibacillus sp. GCM10027626]|uniref:TOMM precursor leader peptide-binding protein n=1 Tax=Paenibacillus sp. GCM10027626 TaxID=3273411 RepID=UPI00364033B5
MSAIVAIVGSGSLAELVAEELGSFSAGKYFLVRQEDFSDGLSADAADLVLVVSDGWKPALHLEAETICRQKGTPWLRGFIAFGEGIIGPLVRPNSQGCSQCADMRLLMAGSDRKETWALQRRMSAQGGVQRDCWATDNGLRQMASMIGAEARRYLQGDDPARADRMLLLQMQTLKCSSHFFLPDPLCGFCSSIPDDSKEAARIVLRENPKISEERYRVRSMDQLKKVLEADYLDARSGFLNVKMIDLVSPFADASINLPLFSGDEGCAGRTNCYEDSQMTAILEGLERYCGLSPRGKRSVVRDSYRNLSKDALNPLQVGVHSKEQYEAPHFPFQPFDADKIMDWVWGYSFREERPILVPELLAYYSAGCGHGFVYETSNGCAMGGSLEEAIFYGILEVVERDSFLLTWYAQLPLPRIDPYSSGDLEMNLMLDRLQAVAGYDIHLFNSTMETGIPSLWAIAKNRKQTGVNLVCAAGAHPDPLRAAKSAIHEIAGMLMTVSEKFEQSRQQYESMLDDPFLVTEMEDHSMLYGLPQAEERLRFLLDDNRPLRSFAEEFAAPARNADLTDDLKALLHRLTQSGLDVIVVDQTAPETLRNGLHCVKVLIPGMLPMTFGHRLVRLEGLERALTVPAQLGYTSESLTPDLLNPYPHPFP